MRSDAREPFAIESQKSMLSLVKNKPAMTIRWPVPVLLPIRVTPALTWPMLQVSIAAIVGQSKPSGSSALEGISANSDC